MIGLQPSKELLENKTVDGSNIPLQVAFSDYVKLYDGKDDFETIKESLSGFMKCKYGDFPDWVAREMICKHFAIPADDMDDDELLRLL